MIDSATCGSAIFGMEGGAKIIFCRPEFPLTLRVNGGNMGFEVACGGLEIPRRDGGKLVSRAPYGDIDGSFLKNVPDIFSFLFERYIS